jgi:NAD(P)-dependent dehydrogenase (short-subunit alcohol dehydrogenase family)
MVVGGSSGVGAAIAARLSQDHQVSVLARRTDRVPNMPNLAPYSCDVTDGPAIGDIVKAAVADHGKLRILVYCAGQQLIKPLRAVSADDTARIISVNLTAAVIFGGLFASPRLSENDAVFCAISSIAAHRPEPAIIPYAAAKAGVEALVKGLARECAPRRAVAVAPGWLDTEMTQGYGSVYNEAFRERLETASPRGIATVDEVADLALFLTSDRASRITGQVVTIDGGASL